MRYEGILPARFLERPNRFVAYVETERGREICHVKNTGRCAELLIPGAKLYVQRVSNPARKTALDLIGVRKGDRLINMDSQAPNQAVEEWLRAGHLFSDAHLIQREKKFRNSRFDFYVETPTGRSYLEVKGVTLEDKGIARFPDAPTERGIKHLRELAECIREGYGAYVLFVIQMEGVRYFTPNMDTAPEFGEALAAAGRAGVNLLAYDCRITENTMELNNQVPIYIEGKQWN